MQTTQLLRYTYTYRSFPLDSPLSDKRVALSLIFIHTHVTQTLQLGWLPTEIYILNDFHSHNQ